MKQRSIPVCIILTLVTCGIYGLYWFYCLTNDTNAVTGHEGDTSGGMALLFTIVTCGIYSIYWAYKMGEKLKEMNLNNGKPTESWNIIFLVLAIFGLEIIAWALLQSELNKCLPAA